MTAPGTPHHAAHLPGPTLFVQWSSGERRELCRTATDCRPSTPFPWRAATGAGAQAGNATEVSASCGPPRCASRAAARLPV